MSTQVHDDRPLAALIDAFDWRASALGPRETWPPALRYAVSACLASGFATLIWWGDEAIQIYNDSYAELLGKRHPAALGQPGAECWHEIWDEVTEILSGVRATGKAFSAQDMRFQLERNGYVEETYFTFAYSRIDDDAGGIGGFIVTTTETTKSVLRERDFRMLSDTLPSIIYTHRLDGTIEWANARWYDFSGLPQSIALTPEGWARVVHADHYERLLETFAHAFAASESYALDLRMKPESGGDDTYRWFHARAEPIRAEDGEIVRWVGSATDVHEAYVAAQAMRSQLDREHRASHAFQRAALPQALPSIPGLHFNAVYEPAGAEALVGGDWYDAFRLPDGRVILSVGDVMGTGLGAAITMAAVRQSIRGAAQIYPDPAAVLDAADRALRSEQPDAIVTAFLGILDPLTLTITYASAGHPPPFVRDANGSVHGLDAADLPLGLRETMRREPASNGQATLANHSLLVLYTDGLTEATRDALAGEHRLREILANEAVMESADPAMTIRATLPTSVNDDLAIMTVRVELVEQTSNLRWSFPADDAELGMRARREIGEVLQRLGSTASEAYDAELIFGELLGNVVRHAKGDAEAILDLAGEWPVLNVLDRGSSFRFFARLPTDAMSESGRGLYISSTLARDLIIVPRNGGGSHARAVLAFRVRNRLAGAI